MRTEEWINNPASFRPSWADEWQIPSAMLDFDEKWNSFHDPNGRVMGCAHRGDRNILYPENTLEAYQSAIMCGSDILEIDLHTTLDGEIVLMHDDDLKRMTDLYMLRESGETWMPESDIIDDWTLEQIKRLRIVDQHTKEVTGCAVPTLRECLKLAKGHCFVTLDKIRCFDWDKVYDIIRELGVYREVLIPYNYDKERVYSIRRKSLRETGYALPFFAACGRDGGIMDPELMLEDEKFLREHDMAPLLRGGEHIPEESEQLEYALSQIRGTHRIYAECLRKEHDNEENWLDMIAAGYSIIMGNKTYDLMKFIQKRHFS